MAALIIAGEAIFLLPFIVMRVFKPIIRDVFRISDFEIGEAQALYGITDRRMTEGNGEPPPKYPSYRSKIPWDLKLAYSLTYNNSRNQRDFSNNSVMFSGNVELTPMWNVGLSSGYDFKGKGFTYTQLRFDRDLKSWRLNFSWVPFSDRASWNFFIGIKSGLLSDIKYEKQSEPNRSY